MNPAKQLTTYIKDAKEELKHVTWPTKKEVKRHTLLVIAISLVTAVFLGVVDYFLTIVMAFII